MPIYDYVCGSCNHSYEENRKIADRDNLTDVECLECHKIGQISRQVGSPLVAYSVATNGYKHPEGFREVLQRIHSRAPGSQMDKTSSYL